MDLPISVIVPIYNAGYFLPQCIESILAQTFSKFELLLVDDGSTDTSLEICTKYAAIDKRISVFHKKNGGVTSTRKYGIERANGEYICFVDADDRLPENALLTLVDKNLDFDIIIGTYKEICNSKEKINIISKDLPREFKGLDYIQFQLKNLLYHAPWGKLIKKTCFNEVTFDIPQTIFRGEDYIMNLRLGLLANHIKIIDEIVYQYIVRETSCMQTRMPSLEYEKSFDLQLTRFLTEQHIYELIKNSLLYQRAEALIGLILAKASIDSNDPFVKTITKEIQKSPFELKFFLLRMFFSSPVIFRLLYKIGLKTHIL